MSTIPESGHSASRTSTMFAFVAAATFVQLLFPTVLLYAREWDLSLLEGDPRMPPNAPLEEMVQRNTIEVLDWGCLFQTDKPGHSKNKWNDLEINRTEVAKQANFLPGTTFWINEHMAVGHLMYDIQLIQVLQSTKIDRIVLQRAPCINPNLCSGIGSFDSFFKGYFTAAIDAFQPGIPVHVRWVWQDRNAKPLYVTSAKPDDYADVPPEKRAKDIHLHPHMCMERCIRNLMRCIHCFYPSLSADAVQKFKKVAYSLVKRDPPLLHHFESSNKPYVVTLAHRGLSASRHIANVPFMQHLLEQAFAGPKYEFRIVDTTNDRRGYAEQIKIVAESNVVIAEHGAFQSNIIYMRNGSLLVDLQGDYPNGELAHFRDLGRMFGVFVSGVTTPGLTSHHWDEFNITSDDCTRIVQAVEEYIDAKPFAFNTI